MRRSLPRAIFVKLSAVTAAAVFLIGLYRAPFHGAPPHEVVASFSSVMLSVVLVMGLGLSTQLLYHYALGRSRRWRPGD